MSKTQSATTGDPLVEECAAIVAAWPPDERAEREKKFVRKIDYRLLPILVSDIPVNESQNVVCYANDEWL